MIETASAGCFVMEASTNSKDAGSSAPPHYAGFPASDEKLGRSTLIDPPQDGLSNVMSNI